MSSVENVIACLGKVAGVVSVRVFENRAGEKVGSMPPHSVAIEIEGGENEAIAEAMCDCIPFGTLLVGDVAVCSMSGHYFKFSRPRCKHGMMPAIVDCPRCEEVACADAIARADDLQRQLDAVTEELGKTKLAYEMSEAVRAGSPGRVSLLERLLLESQARSLEMSAVLDEVLDFLLVYGDGSGNSVCIVEILAHGWHAAEERMEEATS